jgi:TolB-like protein/DNA-binding winged helix-turn-helix (wHTH) protein
MTARLRIADLTLEPGQRRVARNGQALHLGKLSYEMLVALVEASPNVLTQEELAARVWNGRFATPETVAQRVKLLRSALDDDPGRPRYIEVLRGQGYRLIPPVERVSDVAETLEPAAPPEPVPSGSLRSHRLWAGWAAGALLVAAAIGASLWFARVRDVPAAVKSIAVLPFADMSEAKDQQYIADGVAEEILNRLSQSKDLRVIARTSSFALRDKALDVPQIVAKLGVSHVIEGSVRKSGSRVRVTAQLIDASINAHIWSQTYDRGLGDLFAIQDDIASSVATALAATIDGMESRGRGPKSIEAYERYLRGQVLYNRRGPGDLQQATRYFEEAVALDPGYARAWAALSGAYSMLVHYGHVPPERGYPLQRDAALRAVQLDPGLAVAQNRLARYYADVGDRAKAAEHSRIARELDPDDPLVLGGQAGMATRQGDLETSVKLLRRAVARDPLSSLVRGNLASDLTASGRYEEALAESRAVKEIDPGQSEEMDFRIAQLHVLLGRLDQADAVVEDMPPGRDRDRALALLSKVPDRREAADDALARLVDRAAQEPGAAVAEIYAYRGLHEQAIAALEAARRSLQQVPSPALEVLDRFQLDLRFSPFLAPVRKDPRVQALLERD